MYTDIRTEPCVAYHRDLALNASYNQLPFYFNAHKKEPSDLSSRRKVERHPDYNHLEHQQRTENDIELTSRVGEVEQSDVSSKRTAVRHFKVIPWKGCTNSSTKCLGALLTTALVVGCLALLLATIALSITGRPSSSSGFNELQLMEEIKQLKSQVGTLQENQMNNSTNEQKLTKEIWQLQSQVGTLQESQTTLQLLVDTLKKQVNSPVNLYQNCIEETRSCRMGQNQPNVYRRECVTGQVPIEEPVSIQACSHTPLL